MNRRQVDGTSRCFAAGVPASGAHCRSPTVFGAVIPSGSVSGIIVGLGPDADYLPMLWETFRHSKPRTKWVDFKYQKGRSPWGLSKHLILEKPSLVRLLQAYDSATRRV